MTSHVRPIAGIALYFAGTVVSLAWINEPTGAGLWALGPQIAACLLLGWLLEDWIWTALAFAFVPTLLAAPFGTAEDPRGEGGPLALVELILMPPYLALILVGYALRRRADAGRLGSRP